MKRNLEMMGGLVFSEQIMLALIANRPIPRGGVRRGAAQRGQSVGGQKTSASAIESDPIVKERLTAQDIAHAFDMEYHLKNLQYTYEALGI